MYNLLCEGITSVVIRYLFQYLWSSGHHRLFFRIFILLFQYSLFSVFQLFCFQRNHFLFSEKSRIQKKVDVKD